MSSSASTATILSSNFMPNSKPSHNFLYQAPSSPSYLPMLKTMETHSENEETVITSSGPENSDISWTSPSSMDVKKFLACSTPIENKESKVQKELKMQRDMIMESLTQVRKFREDFVRTPEVYKKQEEPMSRNSSMIERMQYEPLRTKRERAAMSSEYDRRCMKNDSFSHIYKARIETSRTPIPTGFKTIPNLKEFLLLSIFGLDLALFFGVSFGSLSVFYICFLMQFFSLVIYDVFPDKYLYISLLVVSATMLVVTVPFPIQVCIALFMSFFTLRPEFPATTDVVFVQN